MALGSMTLLQLRTLARQRADMLNQTGVYTSAFITDTELNTYINQSYYELYDILVQKYGDDYYVTTPQTITTDGTNYLYALPANFYKLLGVDLLLNATPTAYIPIKRFNFADRGSNLFLGSIPQAGNQVRIWFVPRMVELVADSDLCDGVSGWTEYIAVDAAIKMKDKEESDTSVLQSQKDKLLLRIESASENRDAANPQTVVDSQAQALRWPYGASFAFAGNTLQYRLQGNNIWLENASVGSMGSG